MKEKTYEMKAYGLVSKKDTEKMLGVGATTLWRITQRGFLKSIPKGSYFIQDVQKLLLDNSWRTKIGRPMKGGLQVKY